MGSSKTVSSSSSLIFSVLKMLCRAWHKGAAKREQQKKKTRRIIKPPPVIEIFDNLNWLQMVDMEGDDPDYMDSDVELIPRPIQRARRRRG